MARRLPRDLKLYALAVACMGAAGTMVDSSFNNYLASSWDLGGLGRSALELPRELPGFLNVFAAAALGFLPARRVGALAFALQAAGILALAYLSPTFPVMTCWLFAYSLGQHVFLPMQQSLGMELARDGAEGALLGKANAVKNLAQLAGAAFVFFGFRSLGLGFRANFVAVAAVLAVGAAALALMSAPKASAAAPRLLLRREYGLFYVLSVLFGTRKQLFITFAPWVVVSVYGKPTSIMAALFFAGGLAGVVFQPLIGRAVDRLGERFVLGAEAVLLVPVCLVYGFAESFLPKDAAFVAVCACYAVDSLLLSFGIARSTYLKKIALRPEDVAPTLAMGISIDHVFSIAVALAAGAVWDAFGYRWVFLLGAGIALANLAATRAVKLRNDSRKAVA